MKKATLIFMLLICTLIGCSNIKSEDNKCLYNDMYWGTSRENVIKEKGEPDSYYPNSTLQYNEKYMGNDCVANYFFDDDDKLEMIKVGGELKTTYKDIKSMFLESYGEPISEAKVEVDNSFVANWEEGITTIQLVVNENITRYIITYYKKTE